MRTIFNQLKFNRNNEFKKHVEKSNWQFFIPGINSGVYSPASLHIHVLIKTLKAGFFDLKFNTYYSDITLTPDEFDKLFEEMRKIKELRNNIDVKK